VRPTCTERKVGRSIDRSVECCAWRRGQTPRPGNNGLSLLGRSPYAWCSLPAVRAHCRPSRAWAGQTAGHVLPGWARAAMFTGHGREDVQGRLTAGRAMDGRTQLSRADQGSGYPGDQRISISSHFMAGAAWWAPPTRVVGPMDAMRVGDGASSVRRLWSRPWQSRRTRPVVLGYVASTSACWARGRMQPTYVRPGRQKARQNRRPGRVHVRWGSIAADGPENVAMDVGM
jgi:hypothetical protein